MKGGYSWMFWLQANQSNPRKKKILMGLFRPLTKVVAILTRKQYPKQSLSKKTFIVCRIKLQNCTLSPGCPGSRSHLDSYCPLTSTAVTRPLVQGSWNHKSRWMPGHKWGHLNWQANMTDNRFSLLAPVGGRPTNPSTSWLLRNIMTQGSLVQVHSSLYGSL